MSLVYSFSLSLSFFVSFFSLTLLQVGSKLRFFSQGCMVAAAVPTFASSPIPIQRDRLSALSQVSTNSHGTSKTLIVNIIISSLSQSV